MSLTSTAAGFIVAPRDPDLQSLYEYWDAQRRGRAMPSRGDIDPSNIPKLLQHIVLYDVAAPGGPYTIRLVGSQIEQFIGQNTTGRAAGSFMDEPTAARLVHILDAVVTERAPRFRAGAATWHPERLHRDFEACFLPLSADGNLVNMILGAIKFPPTESSAF